MSQGPHEEGQVKALGVNSSVNINHEMLKTTSRVMKVKIAEGKLLKRVSQTNPPLKNNCIEDNIPGKN
jgi:hypothetical protein